MKALLAIIALLLATGCTYMNRPLNAPEVPVENRVYNHTRADLSAQLQSPSSSSTQPQIFPGNQPPSTEATVSAGSAPDGCFVGLSLSGGGSRAANFGAACMFELQRLRLLQHVNYISSVSGGSLTAAYFCCSSDGAGGWNPGEVQRRLTHAFASDMLVALLEPWNLFALAFTDRSRSDLLYETLRDNLFTREGHELTFADLRPERPHLLINSTDLQSGKSFLFCNQSFDQLNSDLGQYPLAHAVAASAAVPVVLHQVNIEDYSTTFPQYRHLIDGGVIDNLGVKALLETYDAQMRAAQAAGAADPYPNGAVLFVIDSSTSYDGRLSDKRDIGIFESLASGISLTASVLVNNASSSELAEMIVRYSPDDARAADLRKEIEALDRDGYLTLSDRRGKPVHIVTIALAQLSKLSNAPFASFYEKVNSIATYFNISPSEAANLYQASQLLIRGRLNRPLREIASQFHESPTTLPDEVP
jgi:predicted acylesterase/phospholipase RssA